MRRRLGSMATLIGGPRVLLRQLRETMAEPLGAQERLDKIVDLIADNMRADVCSFYVLRDDGALELFATARPQARIRPHDHAAAGRGPGRPDRGRGRAAEP